MNEGEVNFNPDKNQEIENKTNYNIWYVDDDESNLKAIERLAKAYGFELFGFQKASEAINDLKDFLKKKMTRLLPGFIIVDFSLDQKVDEKSYRTGDKLIKAIIDLYKIYDVELPQIIGASGSEESNKVLSQTGANITYQKTELSKFFIDLKKEQEDERNRGDQGTN